METLPKLIPAGTKRQNNKQQPQPAINSQQQKRCNKKRNVFKVNKKEARTTSTVSLFLTLSLTLNILVPLLLTLNIFHILHDVKNAKIRALYWKKEKKVVKCLCFSSRI